MVSSDIWCKRVALRNIFEPLVLVTTSGKYRPFLASEMKIEAAGRRLRFKLRSGVRFHDGRPLTSADVRYTLEALVEGKASTLDLLRAELSDMADVLTPDTKSVEIVLKRRNHLFPSVLAEIGILPAHLYKTQGLRNLKLNRSPIGTGPFRVAGREANRALTLVLNEKYWGSRPRLGSIRFVAIPDPMRALAALRNGELDILSTVHPSYYPGQFRTKRMARRFRVLKLHPYRMQVMVYNVSRRHLKDRRVRLALAHLADRQRMVGTIRNNLAQVLSGPLWTLTPWYDRAIHPRSFNRLGAERMLASAGWERRAGRRHRQRMGWPLKLGILRSRESSAMARAARILKAEMQAAGIDADIKVGDFGFVKAQLERGRFDIALIGISPRPMSDLSPLLHSKGRLNVGRYANPTVDRLLDALRATPPHRDRLRSTKTLHRLLHDDPPLTVLYAPIEMIAVSRGIHGLANNGLWPRFAALSLGSKR